MQKANGHAELSVSIKAVRNSACSLSFARLANLSSAFYLIKVLLLGSLLSWGMAWAAPNDNMSAEERNQAVAQTVWGIVGYTRWDKDVNEVQMCVVGPTEYADELLKGAVGVTGSHVKVRRMHVGDEQLANSCDAIYAGLLSEEQWRGVRARMTGKAMLSISEKPQLCSIGAMFCLDLGRPGASFEVNLDSVARSGVRINPRVLNMARRKGEK